MKILLVYSETEPDSAAPVKSLLGKMNVQAELFPVRFCSDGDVVSENQFAAGRDSFGSFWNGGFGAYIPSHVLILSQLPQRWMDFLAGFSLGARIPFVVYGEKAAAGIPGDFCIVFRTAAMLEQYIGTEIEIAKKRDVTLESCRARETLLNEGIPVTEESLVQCVGNSAVETVALFFTAGFSPDTRDTAGVPLLNTAARKGNRDMVKLLLKSGAHVELLAEDRDSSALLDAVMGKFDDIAADLIDAGTDVNIRSKDGQSALIVAVGANNDVAVETLLKAGADPDVPDSLGVSARRYAALFHKAKITTLFDSYAPQKAV